MLGKPNGARGNVVTEPVPPIHTGPMAQSEDVRRQLERILNSSDFEATARERKFLSYVVGEELNGRGNRIKAYSIAVEVFGRDASFDPQNDPIVRIEAGHLRRSLERYYLTSGHADQIRIEIPKGGYVPTFAEGGSSKSIPGIPSSPTELPPPSSRQWQKFLLPGAILLAFATSSIALTQQFLGTTSDQQRPETPRLLVQKFEDLSETPGSAMVAKGLTQEVIGQLSRFRKSLSSRRIMTVPLRQQQRRDMHYPAALPHQPMPSACVSG